MIKSTIRLTMFFAVIFAVGVPGSAIGATTASWRDKLPVSVHKNHKGPIPTAGEYWDTLTPVPSDAKVRSTKGKQRFSFKGAANAVKRATVIIICTVGSDAPNYGGGGVSGIASVSCSQKVDVAKNRVCIQVLNQNTGGIATDNNTCKPSPDPNVITGCSNCAYTGKLSYSTAFCFGHFSYRTYSYGWASKAGYGSGGAQDSSLWRDIC